MRVRSDGGVIEKVSPELKGGQGLEDAEELQRDWKWSETHLLAVCPEHKPSLDGGKSNL